MNRTFTPTASPRLARFYEQIPTFTRRPGLSPAMHRHLDAVPGFDQRDPDFDAVVARLTDRDYPGDE